MKKLLLSNPENNLILLLIITNFFIIVGAGQSYGFLGMSQLLSIFYYLNDNISFTFAGNYDDRLFAAGLFGLIGNIMLIVAFYSHSKLFRLRHIIIGSSLLLFSFFLLVKGFVNEPAARISLVTGIPFLLSFCAFTVLLLRKYSRISLS